jgi:hypothetical protein
VGAAVRVGRRGAAAGAAARLHWRSPANARACAQVDASGVARRALIVERLDVALLDGAKLLDSAAWGAAPGANAARWGTICHV